MLERYSRLLATLVLLTVATSYSPVCSVKASSEGETIWTQTSNPSSDGDVAFAVAVDSSGVYVAGDQGLDDDVGWRIEKRSPTDGSLLWTQTSNPSTNVDEAYGIAVDGSGVYIAGYDDLQDDWEWRVEKRNLTDGSLLWAQTSNPGFGWDAADGIAVDGSGVYVVGWEYVAGRDNSWGNYEWRIEKRTPADGSLLWNQTENLETGDTYPLDVAVDDSGLYVVGYDYSSESSHWRIQKRRVTDGSLVWTQTSDPTDYGWAYGIAVDDSGVYIAGDQVVLGAESDSEWRVEKRNLADGSLLWVQTSNPGPGLDEALGAAVDGSGLYVIGYEALPDHLDYEYEWRIEKRSLTDGLLLWTQTENPSMGAEEPVGVAVDDSGLYIVGWDFSSGKDDSGWRIEKRAVTPRSVVLAVSVPNAVSVSVDGVRQLPGPARLDFFQGTSHSIEVPDIVQLDSGTRLRFDAWSDEVNLTSRYEILSSDADLSAVYVTQYLLTTDSVLGDPTGSGWHDAGSAVTFSVPPTQPMSGIAGVLGAKWAFRGWYEDGRLLTNRNGGTMSMNQPRSIEAQWEADYTAPLVTFLVIAAVALISGYVIKRRKPSEQRSN